jgi:hypothetical protein
MGRNYDFDVKPPQFDENGIAKSMGWVKTYCCDVNTREFTEARYEYVVETTGLSAGSYLDRPSQPPAGYAVVRSQDGKSWEFVEDKRGKVCYNKETRQETTIDYLGPLRDEFTFLKPKTEFDEWVNDKWQTNLTRQQEHLVRLATSKKQELIDDADDHISYIISAKAANDVTEAELESLPKWEAYRRALFRLDVSLAPNIVWPENEAKFKLPGY